jgi:hypothetical protein
MSAPPQTPPNLFKARADRDGWAVICDESLAFDDAKLKAVLDIWQAVRGARPLPMRADFTARILLRHLPDIAFIERLIGADGARRYRFRLVGSAQAATAGDFTGKFLDEVIPAANIESWLLAFDTVLAIRRPLRIVSRFRALDLAYMTAESLIAPLCDMDGTPSGFLTSVAYSGHAA